MSADRAAHMEGLRVCVLIAVLCAAAQPARADAPTAEQATEADAHFKRGVALYKEQSLGAALVEFRKAYAVLPDSHVLYNIGITQLELKDDAGALATFERYLREAPTLGEKRREEVEAQVERLRGQVGALRVSVNRDGAEIAVDDVPTGTSPLPTPLVVNVGTRRVTATLPHGPAASRVVDVASRDVVDVDLTLVEPTAAPPEVAPALAAPAVHAATGPTSTGSLAPSGPPTIAWLGLSTTGGLAVAGAVTGVLALQAKTDASTAAAQLGVSTSTIDDANTRKHLLAGVTDGLLAGAVVAGGVTLYLFLHHPAAQSGAALSGGWSVAVRPAGANLAWWF